MERVGVRQQALTHLLDDGRRIACGLLPTRHIPWAIPMGHYQRRLVLYPQTAPNGGMVRCLWLAARLAVYIAILQEVGGLGREQQMVDAQAVVLLPGTVNLHQSEVQAFAGRAGSQLVAAVAVRCAMGHSTGR